MSEAQTEIELDIDGIEEEQVEVDSQKEETESVQDAVGEVDLGYTDPIKEKTQSEVVEEDSGGDKEADNLRAVSEKTQKRIDKLTRKMREAERKEAAALDYAKGLQKKYADVEKSNIALDTGYAKEFDARVDAQKEQVRIKLQDAIDSGDSSKIVEANDELAQLAVQKEKARVKLADMERAQKEREIEQPAQVLDNIQKPNEEKTPAPASPRAQEWAEGNKWFGSDKAMTNAAFGIHEDLVEQGFDSESDDYYNEINNQMRDYFPSKFSTEKVDDRRPVQTVASAGRKQQGRRTVKLTRSQVAIAKKLGVPLEEYAKYVKE